MTNNTNTNTNTNIPSGTYAGERREFGIHPGVKMAFRWCPPGTYMMGSPENEPNRYDDEGPQTEVTFTEGFWMAETPVTQEQWQAVMGNNPSHFSGNPNNPVECVSWNDANNFCSKLALSARLPHEAEWEYACRAGTTTPYSCPAERLSEFAVFNSDSTTPVRSKLPNPWGLYDMHGNVWEWCLDEYSSKLPGGKMKFPKPVNPIAQEIAALKERLAELEAKVSEEE